MGDEVRRIPLARLVPRLDQPRQHFDQKALEQLADSMRQAGFIGAITVRTCPGRPGDWEILAGHRRVKAAVIAHLSEVPAQVVTLDDREARQFVLLDNLNRQDFLPWEEGSGFAELVADGVDLVTVAGKAGRSVQHVTGRIKLATTLGKAAREAYLAGGLAIGALDLIATMPDKVLAPCECPSCHRVNAEGAEACRACKADLAEVLRVPCGNPQTVAAKLCRGKAVAVVAEQMARIAETYGIGPEAVQTSLGFDDLQVSQEAIAIRSEVERRLEAVGKASEWVLKNAEALASLLPEQKRAVDAQCDVAIGFFGRVKAAVRA